MTDRRFTIAKLPRASRHIPWNIQDIYLHIQLYEAEVHSLNIQYLGG